MKSTMPFVRSLFNYDRNAASDESGLDCSSEPSLTKQSFAEECDINTIVRRFNLTGELPSGVRVPSYGDFADVFDFHSAMNVVAEARESFEAMPAEVRARFHNNPGEFVDFCSDASNIDEMKKLGLLTPVVDPGIIEDRANLRTDKGDDDGRSKGKVGVGSGGRVGDQSGPGGAGGPGAAADRKGDEPGRALGSQG